MRSPEILHSLVIMNLLFVTATWSLARPSVRASVLLVLVAVAWVLWNEPIEGRVIYFITIQHGVTESDVLSVIAVLIAVVGVWRVRRSRI